MTTPPVHEVPEAVEPVHWGARLVRSPDCCYTEVSGTPCIVRARHGDVQALTPTWAAIWARLDGRPVADALNVDPTSLGPTDARNLVEVLRRLKGKGVVCDADPTSPPRDRHDLETLAPDASTPVDLRGSASRDGARLLIDPAASERVTVALTEGPAGTLVTIRRRLRRRRVTDIEVAAADGGARPERPAERLTVIVRAIEDRSVLLRPGLVDLLAGVAERAHGPGSPRR